ncbi:MAG: peptidoglycan recognition family protein [Bacteroidota bacterium]
MKQKEQYVLIAFLVLPFLLFGRSSSTQLHIMNVVNTLQRHPSLRYRTRSKNTITQVVLHHSGGSTGSPERYARQHVEDNGWPGIGYHFVIQPEGKVFQTNEITTISYHATNCNTIGIGICLTGNFNETNPTLAQLRSLKTLIRTIENDVGRKLNIVGHRDCKNTSCPGHNFDVAAFAVDYRNTVGW